MIPGWVLVPLSLVALVAVGVAVFAQRDRRRLADAAAREEVLAARVADLEQARTSARSELAALTASEDGGDELEAGDTGALTDPDTGLFNEQFFRVTLETRVSAARRHLRPVAVVLVQVARGVREGEPTPTAPTTGGSRSSSRTLRRTARCGRSNASAARWRRVPRVRRCGPASPATPRTPS